MNTWEFCTGQMPGSECVNPKLPDCEDRTVKCLDALPLPDDMDVTNNTITSGAGATAKDSQSMGAKFTYKCKKPGKKKYISLLALNRNNRNVLLIGTPNNLFSFQAG